MTTRPARDACPPDRDNHTLHARLRAELERRLAVARAATPGPWMSASHTGRKDGIALVGRVEDRGTGRAVAVLSDADVHQRHRDAEHIALHDPADAIRRYEGELEVLERHAPYPVSGGIGCDHCTRLCHSRSGLGCDSPDAPYPCDEIRSLTVRLGVSVDDG